MRYPFSPRGEGVSHQRSHLIRDCPAFHWVSQLRRILDVSDNQVRALRRRDLIGRFEAGALTEEASLVSMQGYGRFGAYWGIDTDPSKLAPDNALPCPPAEVSSLAGAPTRLSNLGDDVSKKLVNWGYAICDRSVRAKYKIQDTRGQYCRVSPPGPSQRRRLRDLLARQLANSPACRAQRRQQNCF